MNFHCFSFEFTKLPSTNRLEYRFFALSQAFNRNGPLNL